MSEDPTTHATCVEVMGYGVLLRGRAGSGKSSCALALLDRPGSSPDNTRLVSDDRVILQKKQDKLHAFPPSNLAGLLEVRGIGILQMDYAPSVSLDLVVDFVAVETMDRIPATGDQTTVLETVSITRITILERNPHAATIIRSFLRYQLG